MGSLFLSPISEHNFDNAPRSAVNIVRLNIRDLLEERVIHPGRALIHDG